MRANHAATHPKEIIAGIQRTLSETLMPELKSPFAISQAGTAAMVLGAVSEWIEAFPRHNAAEIEDLKQTFDALRPHGESAILEAAGFREAIDGGMRASDEEPPDYNAMEKRDGRAGGRRRDGDVSPGRSRPKCVATSDVISIASARCSETILLSVEVEPPAICPARSLRCRRRRF